MSQQPNVNERTQVSLNYKRDDDGEPIIPEKAKKAIKDILDPNIWVVELEGAKRASKDVYGLLGYAPLLDRHPDKFHLAIATNQPQALMLILTANGFGIKDHFPNGKLGKGLDDATKDKLCFKFIDSIGREKVIVFSGGMNQDSYKTFRGPSYGTAYINEANLCHINTLNEAKDRTMASSLPKIIITQNPDNPQSTFYLEFEKTWQQKPDEMEIKKALSNGESLAQFPYYNDNPNDVWDGPHFRYHHFTQKDNPIITKERYERNRESFASETERKRHFEGIRIAGGELIYGMFSEKNLYGKETDLHKLTYEDKIKFKRYIGVDVGYTNPQAYLNVYMSSDYTIYVDDCWGWDSKEEGKYQKTSGEYTDDLKQFVYKDSMGRYNNVIIDPSATDMIQTSKRKGFRVKKADNSVGMNNRAKSKTDNQKKDNRNSPVGIPLVQDGIKHLKILINRRCEPLIKEIYAYVWDEKSRERGIDKPLKINDHFLDALRYIINTIIKKINKWIRKEYLDYGEE